MTQDTAYETANPYPAKNALQKSKRLDGLAKTSLKYAAMLWFSVAIIGQLLFVYYILGFYVLSAMKGNLAAWSNVLPHGYIKGDSAGNFAIITHIFLATSITLAGILQLIPQVRARAPKFHRWNGRIYLSSLIIAATTGLYMVWFRNGVGDFTQHLGISLNAVLILLCAAMALRHALARQFTQHRRWALRLFLVANGVWFFRIGLMFWIAINQGPAGFNPKTFEGPFLSFISFANSLIPLIVCELYLRAQDSKNKAVHFSMAGTLLVLSAASGMGIFVAFMGMWLPRL
ncbi:DUF2306 domain-containing protein [Undibacterium sp.]|uniref:DUF2306 domain-containing protein n=1 Tax=Undibacterium sp. TaxID=1914977 RepID=UPI0027303472|nr:DUF2306 domain-containing protein [Undibacterium sp.]MDP1977071.1 DUF2306 domain-containing protein [Undibacterium sp.]